MIEYNKTRDAASQALIDLRTKMGKTQAAFAAEVLKTPVTTIARYETSHRPPGEMLMRLSSIAREHGTHDLSDKFRLFYLQDALKAIGSQLTLVPEEGSTPAHGYLTTSLSGELAVRGAQAFITWLSLINNSANPKIEKGALDAIEDFEGAVRKTLDRPGLGEIHDHIRSAVMAKKEKKD